MTYGSWVKGGADQLLSRQGFLAGAAGLLSTGMTSQPILAATEDGQSAACDDNVQDILNMSLEAERLAMTFYYAGLTSLPLVSHPASMTRGGARWSLTHAQAALDQEMKHAQLLADLGADSAVKKFFFPASAFANLGFTSRRGTFLYVLDHVETMIISLYLVAVSRFGAHGRVDLAELAARILGVECEHRALFRLLSGDDPATNMTLEVAQFGCSGDIASALAPYLTGIGFEHGPTRAVLLPAHAQITRVIGNVVTN